MAKPSPQPATRYLNHLKHLKQVKPGFTNYQPHPGTLGPEVKQKQAWKGEGGRERKKGIPKIT